MSEEFTEEQLAAAKKQLQAEHENTLKDIRQQLFDVGASDLYESDESINALPELLGKNEDIIYASAAFVNNDNTLVVITTKRMIFINAKNTSNVTETTFDKIQDASFKKKLLFSNVTIHTDTAEILLESVEKKVAPIFVEKLNKLIN